MPVQIYDCETWTTSQFDNTKIMFFGKEEIAKKYMEIYIMKEKG